MAVAVSEHELEALPELGGRYTGQQESEQFFGALAKVARGGLGWITAPGSPQRKLALWAARQALNRGLPALGGWVGGRVGSAADQRLGASIGTRAASWLGSHLPQQEGEFEWESQAEVNPMRKIYPDAMMEHLGHAAAETQHEAEAEALAGAMVPLAAQIVPRAAPAILGAAPGLVSGLAGVVGALRQNPETCALVRAVPAIVRGTAVNLANRASSGAPISPQAAVRALAQQTLRVLGSREQAVRAFQRSRALDARFHRFATHRPVCRSCGAFVR